MKIKSVFFTSLISIAIPIILQNLVQSCINMLDTIMVGQLGALEIAAVGLGNQIFFLLTMILFGISSGASIFTAQYWGKKDIPGIRRSMGVSLMLGIGVSLLFMIAALCIPQVLIGFYSKDTQVVKLGSAYLRAVAISYPLTAVSFVLAQTLRSVERVKLSMTATIVSLAVNAILNYWFIFGGLGVPAMGVVGAGIATVISRLIEITVLVIVTYKKKYPPAGSFKELASFDAFFLRTYIIIAMPVILNELFWSFGITMQNIIFARTSTDAIAAFNITNTIAQLTWVFFIGVGNAAAIIIGKKIGERQTETAYDYANRFVILMPIMAVFIGALLFPLSKMLPFFFNVESHILREAALMLIVLMCTYPFKAFNMCMVVGICRSGGDTVFAALTDTLGMWFIALPIAALASFVWGLPPWIVYIFILSEEPIKATVLFIRLKSKKWLHNVTEM